MTNGEDDDEGSLLALALLALVAGVLAGIVGASFRLSLVQADRFRNALIEWAHGQEAVGFVVGSRGLRRRDGDLPPGSFAGTRPTRREAAFLTSRRFCAGSFRRFPFA